MNRRMFIRTAGATLWLPFLPSALPRVARGASFASPRRAIWWFLPNGFMEDFVLSTIIGENYDLRYPLEPLAKIQNRVSVLSNLHNGAAEGRDIHQEAMGTRWGTTTSRTFSRAPSTAAPAWISTRPRNW